MDGDPFRVGQVAGSGDPATTGGGGTRYRPPAAVVRTRPPAAVGVRGSRGNNGVQECTVAETSQHTHEIVLPDGVGNNRCCRTVWSAYGAVLVNDNEDFLKFRFTFFDEHLQR